MSNLVRMRRAYVIVFLTNAKRLFNLKYMDNFKFTFLSRGQLESLTLDKFFLTVFKILPCH